MKSERKFTYLAETSADTTIALTDIRSLVSYCTGFIEKSGDIETINIQCVDGSSVTITRIKS